MAIPMMDHRLSDTAAGDDLIISYGDLVIVESTEEHQRQLLLNDKGDFKENPTSCVGVFNYLDDEGVQELSREVTIAYTQDGMTVNSVQLQPDGLLTVSAGYQ